MGEHDDPFRPRGDRTTVSTNAKRPSLQLVHLRPEPSVDVILAEANMQLSNGGVIDDTLASRLEGVAKDPSVPGHKRQFAMMLLCRLG